MKVRRGDIHNKRVRAWKANHATKLNPIQLNRKHKKWFLMLIFVIGFLCMCFPVVSQYLYHQASKVQVQRFDKEVAEITPSDIERRIKLAEAYNSTIFPKFDRLSDPFTKIQKEGIKEYARMLEINEQIGYVSIPKIHQELPVYAGTNESVLQKGVGHLETTSLPVGGKGTHAVITAHRGLPTARLFTDLDKLKKGDVFYFRNIKETLAYKVDKIKVVGPKDINAIRIVEGEDRMTLLTCTPYMINSHRLLVYGKRIPYQAKLKDKDMDNSPFMNYRIMFYLLIVLIILLIMIYLYYRKRRNKQ